MKDYVKDYMKEWEQNDYDASRKMVDELEKRRAKTPQKPEVAAEIKQAYLTLSHNLNVLGGESEVADEILANLINDHRTLQQGFWRVIFQVMREYVDAFHDARNGGAVEACKKIKDAFPDGFYLPLI